MFQSTAYRVINNEGRGHMTHNEAIIRDGWVIKPFTESQSCHGWQVATIEQIPQRRMVIQCLDVVKVLDCSTVWNLIVAQEVDR